MVNARVAIITGAAQGIGRAIALRLAADGLDVALNDLSNKHAELDQVVSDITSTGRRAIAVPADCTSESAVEAMVNTVVAKLGSVDVMVANAGIVISGPFLDITISDWDRVWSVNVRGPMLCYKYAAIQMVKQGRGGRLIGASSIAGRKGSPCAAAYSATKFAIRGMSHSSAEELAKHNITVNTYAPGFIETAMTTSEKDAENGGPLSTAKLGAGLPLSTPHASPEVIASAVSFFVRPESHFITGQTFGVDGGFHMD